MAKATTVRFTEEMAARLDQASAQTGMPVNSIVIAACLEWMARHVEQTQLLASGQPGTPVERAVPRWSTLRRALERSAQVSLQPIYPFERFTRAAQKLLTRAQAEATGAGFAYIGTEHLLLGAFGDPESDATRVLASLGVAETQIRSELERLLGREHAAKLERIIPTSRVKAVIDLSFRLCGARSDPRVSTGHVLLALASEGEGIAAELMKEHGATPERVESALDELTERES